MVKLSNDLWELVKQHISIYEKLDNSSLSRGQLDFLSFRIDVNKMSKNSPFKWKYDIFRDNPNWEVTEYDNVYQMVEEDKIVLQYVRDWYSPIAILQWYKMKLPSWEKRKISVYWKWLRLFYCGYLDWLPWYIEKYCGEVIRADICWDMKEKIPSAVVDLPNTITYGENDLWTYKWFGNKKSPLFIRIYDKTLDLLKDKNCNAWLYPSRYTKECRRIECKFTWEYAKSLSALQWLWVVDRDWEIQKTSNKNKDYLKSTFYNLIMYLDFLPNKQEEYNLLLWISQMVSKKIKKLSSFISVNDQEND